MLKGLSKVLQFFIDWLRLKEAPITKEQAFGSERIGVHQKTLDRNPAFGLLSRDLHGYVSKLISEYAATARSVQVLEIGSGVIPFSETNPGAISSDIMFGENIQCQLDAMEIPIRNDALHAIVLQNVFHHLPNYSIALQEMERVLEDGGLIILIEPSFNYLSRLVYPKLFSFEGYDCDALSNQRLFNKTGDQVPNQALSFIVFERDEKKFEEMFPDLKILVKAQLPSGLRYLGTGGLNFRRLLPSVFLRLLRYAESTSWGARILGSVALHWVIVIQFKPNNQDT